jgi:hypothetical protein
LSHPGPEGLFDNNCFCLFEGLFDKNRYFDVKAEYCKASPNDILGKYTVTNRGPDPAIIHVVPTLWFRNVWSWGQGPDLPISLVSICDFSLTIKKDKLAYH